MPHPDRMESRLLIERREVITAIPKHLWRKKNQAAVLDFSLPFKDVRTLAVEEGVLRQGAIVELYLGQGTAQQRAFYGYLPSVTSTRPIADSDTEIDFTALDFIGQLQDRYIRLGDSSASYLNPVGQEIGGLVAELGQRVIDSFYATNDFSMRGVSGTNPAQFVTTKNAVYGIKTAKAHIDYYTSLAFDDDNYPNAPLAYEYMMRDSDFIWRKESYPPDTPGNMTFTIGKDAIVSGSISRQPIYSDSLVTGSGTAHYEHSDRDTSRRWGGSRFWATDTVSSDATQDAYEKAVRLVEVNKHEQRSYELRAHKDAFLLYPGDIVSVNAGTEKGIPEGNHRVVEVRMDIYPVLVTNVIVGIAPSLLTDYV